MELESKYLEKKIQEAERKQHKLKMILEHTKQNFKENQNLSYD